MKQQQHAWKQTPVWSILFPVLLLSLAPVQAQTLIGPPRAVTAPGLAGISADGGSFAPVWSGDGQHIAFVSQANDLVTNNDTTTFLNVYMRDLCAGTTRLVSVNSTGRGGGNGNSSYPAISSDGQVIAFLSTATNFAATGADGSPNIFVRDMAAGTTTQVSASTSGATGQGGKCLGLDMTASGCFIAFSSTQTNLVTNSISRGTGGNQVSNIYLRDRQAGTTELITLKAGSSAGASGNSDFPSISADGQRIAFYSVATDLVSWNGSPPSAGQVYLRDRSLGTTVCLGTNAQLVFPGTLGTFNVSLSSDGSAAAFIATNTASGQSALIYYSLATGQTWLINSNVLDITCPPEISTNGQRVAYASTARVWYTINPKVLMWDVQLGSNTLVSADLSGSSISQSPSISADGTRVAFISNSKVLVPGATDGVFQLYVRDLTAGGTRLASPALNGGPTSDQQLCTPQFSPDGARVAFASADKSLVADDLNNATDVFTWSWTTSQVELVSAREPLRASATDRGLPLSGFTSISPDGRFVAFTATDGNLVPDDTNDWSDVFVRDMASGTTLLASGDSSGLPATNGPASNPALSADGRYVAFLRGSPRATVELGGDIYLRDIQTGTLTLVTANNGIGIGTASPPVFSPGGLYLAFSTSNSLAGNDLNQRADVYLYDVQQATNILVSVATNGFSTDFDSLNPVFSPDGQWIVFQSKSPSLAGPALGTSSFQLYARNLTSGITHHVSYAPDGTPLAGDNSNAVFSADSRYVAFKSATSAYSNPICLHDLVAGVNQLVCSNCYSPSVSAGGSKVAYITTNGTQQIYVTTMATGQAGLVSVASDGVSAGNAASWAPLLSSDGRFVVFWSKASNLVPNDTNQVADVFVRDLTLNNTIAISASLAGATTAYGPSVNPILALDGRTVVFESFASDIGANDFNASRDLFLVRLGTGDSDGDGMDDDWEMMYFGNLSHDGSADTDGDGMTDLQEFLAGTNPTNNISAVRCGAIVTVNNGTTVYWTAVPGRTYRVEYKNSLNDTDWQVLADSVTANTATGYVLDDTASPASQRFYRVAVLP